MQNLTHTKAKERKLFVRPIKHPIHDNNLLLRMSVNCLQAEIWNTITQTNSYMSGLHTMLNGSFESGLRVSGSKGVSNQSPAPPGVILPHVQLPELTISTREGNYMEIYKSYTMVMGPHMSINVRIVSHIQTEIY